MRNEKSKNMSLKIGLIGTSWWADAMYLPALAAHPQAKWHAICGRDATKTQAMAHRWAIPHAYNDVDEMIRAGGLDALVVASSNEMHHAHTMAALKAGLHVLCEKPLALTHAQADEMADLAESNGLITLVPFTYGYMPISRFLKQQVDGGFIGQPYHTNLRYYASYGRKTDYMWRFDARRAGAGAIGDIGSHFMYLAWWWLRERAGHVVEVCAMTGNLIERAKLDPEGTTYPQTEDSGVVLMRFESGAQAIIHTTTVAYENTPFGQTHHFELHGSQGTLYAFCDWDTVQQVSGAQAPAGALTPMPIPDVIWGNARRDTVHNTYKDVFRQQDHMTREWVNAIAAGQYLRPNFRDGAVIQRLIDAAILSQKEKRFIRIEN